MATVTVIIPAVAAVAIAGTVATRKGVPTWYRRLEKPPFNPPRWLFAPVWTALYGTMIASAHRVIRRPASPQRTRALALWGLQLGLNGLWSPLFFGMRRPRAALVDLFALLPSIAAYVRAAAKVDRPAGVLMLPYLAWSAFAALLNVEIVRRNPRPPR